MKPTEEELEILWENYGKPTLEAAIETGDYSLIYRLIAMARADETRNQRRL